MNVPFSTFFEWKLSTVKEMDSVTTDIQNKMVSVSKMKDETYWKASVSDKNTISFLQIEPKETLQDMILQTEEWIKTNLYEDNWKTYEEFVSYLEETCGFLLYPEEIRTLFGKDYQKYLLLRTNDCIFEYIFAPVFKDGIVGYFPIEITKFKDTISYTFLKDDIRTWQEEDNHWLEETKKHVQLQFSYITEWKKKK